MFGLPWMCLIWNEKEYFMNLAAIFLFIALMASLFINYLQLRLHYKEKAELFTKFAAKSLQESEYFMKEYPQVVKQRAENFKDEKIKLESMTPEEIRKREIAKDF